MVLMRVENGDIKREWVHFSLHTDVPSLPPEALEGAFGEGATMLHVFLHLLGLIVEDFDLVEEGRRSGFRRGGLRLRFTPQFTPGDCPGRIYPFLCGGQCGFMCCGWIFFFFFKKWKVECQ